MLLSYDFTWLTPVRRWAVGGSDWMKKNFPDKRSWWIDPSGKGFDAGHDHEKWVKENSKLFGEAPENLDNTDALRDGWVRIAFWGGTYVVHATSRISDPQLHTAQEIFHELPEGTVRKVQVETNLKRGFLANETFLSVTSSMGLFEALAVKPYQRPIRSRRKSALPNSRKFLREFPLDELPPIVQQALDVLNLTAMKNELTVPMFVSALKKGEQTIQDELNRTSVEVIQELNNFVEYDAPPKLNF